MVEPTVEAKYFRSGFHKGHVIGMRGLGRFLTGFSGKNAPPFNRIYMGGEMDIRGFDIWGVSPMAYIPSETVVPVLNSDGSARMQKSVTNGVETLTPVTQTIPIYQLMFPGGDTQLLGNFEYRIPIFGPVIVAGFFDAGINRISRPNQLTLNPGRIAELNGKYPQAGFDGNARIAKGTDIMRSSTGVELQVMMPVVNAPFRLYWAYNPQIAEVILRPPIVLDRSMFPNEATFLNSAATWGRVSPFYERRTTFRFSIGRTF
jgi:outer membrane protein insertion porin family